MNHLERTIVWLVLVTFVLSLSRGALGCSCVPEALCPAPDVDLRLVDSAEECPLGSVCCDVPVGEPSVKDNEISTDLFCDGECVPINGGSASDEYDEYGTDLIDIRLVADTRCPTGFTCRSEPPTKAPVCKGTCVPKSMCTMFKMDTQNGGCTGGDVCCSMDRTSWMGLINGINEMEFNQSSKTTAQEERCVWRTESDGIRIPPWLVSIWARMEIVPGLTTDQFVCAGALLDPQYVLTLASCVKDLTVEDLFVNIGDYDLASRSSLRMSNIYSIREKTIHEDYDPPLIRNAALLKLADQVRKSNCNVTLAPTKDNGHESMKCHIVGWNRELLAVKNAGLPRQYKTRVESFNEDLFCAPGTICLHPEGTECESSALTGSPVICDENKPTSEGWSLKGLLVGNCTGVTVDNLGPWVEHQQTPGFVQLPKPTDPSRQYLPPM
ncbi:hypothetical protein ZHAS_00018402 [Anopheles sinensis]|uniref:Peptidase S1 domain-containing protein n=1 Tax=Anopheles sinensis TaxID=74873 RepID=A0A084WHQ1_ANOSI|nr:hypothetical protein ZHAS_00018402 [Anopheles sinensis]